MNGQRRSFWGPPRVFFPGFRPERIPFFLLIIGLAALGACNRPAATPTVAPGAGVVYTAAAQTFEAQLTQVASGSSPSATPSPPPAPTTAPASTDPVPATAAPSNTPAPTTGNAGNACDQAAFVRDVTIPDGTEFLGGEAFTKTWRLRNTGTCTWDAGYSLVFESGDAMGGPASQVLTTGQVVPDQELDVSVELKAPLDPKTYRGNWKLRNPAGIAFGVGQGGLDVFWVEIEVRAPTSTPDPAFTLTFDNVHECGGDQTVILRVQNTGNLAFESAQIVLEQEPDGTDLYGPSTENAPFLGGSSECPPGGSAAGAGTTRYLGAPVASLPNPGTTLRVRVRLCTQDDLKGICEEELISFPAP